MEPSRETTRLSDRLRMCLLGFAIAAGMLLLAGHYAVADAEPYSAYSDPGKTALSLILSEEENVDELQRQFDLTDEEVAEILAAVRKENGKLSAEYAESEKIVASNKSLSDEGISSKIAASDYDETVASAVEETKDGVAALLPEAERDRLAAWVDAQWRQEAGAASDENAARLVETKGGGRTVECRVFATQYIGYTRYEVALPHRGLKFGSRPAVIISRGNRAIRPRVKEVGPWNTYDNYWQTRRKRTMWKDLRRCVPEAQAAYYKNYNRGKDEYGREVLNPAGVDLTPAAARDLGLGRYENGWVYVKFPWLRR